MKKRVLCAVIGSIVCISNTFADVNMPAGATPPAQNEQRPEPAKPSTPVIVEVTSSVRDIAVAADNSSQVQTEEKTRNEIRAMLTDIVRKAKNVVVIEHAVVAANSQPAVDSNQLIVGDQPHGQFRLFADIAPTLSNDKNPYVELKLQILHAGHSGDKQDMNKPLAEKVIKINPANVRASDKEIIKFLESQIHFGDGEAQHAMQRPTMDMWIEVQTPNGVAGAVENGKVPEGSTIVVYYKPNQDSYVNLYIVGDSGKVDRLVPSYLLKSNFSKADHIYRFPPTGDGLPVSGKGENKIRVVYTRIPSGLGSDMGLENGLQARQAPIAVIPTQYPAIFATQNLEHFFSLPNTDWNEKDISFNIN